MLGKHIPSDVRSIMAESLKIKSQGGNLIQLFIDVTSSYIKMYKMIGTWLKTQHIKCVVHASYNINLSSPFDEYSFGIKQFITEIKIANKLKAFAIVVHTGKRINMSQEEALNNMFTSLLYVHKQTLKYENVKILIETPAGQGSEICSNIIDLAYFFEKLTNIPRFGICIDTCHIFVAGVDIRSHEKIDQFFSELDIQFGLKKINLIHLNDSQEDFDSHIDRHANIGQGKIGKDSLLYFAKFGFMLNIPVCLETPIDTSDINEILISVRP